MLQLGALELNSTMKASFQYLTKGRLHVYAYGEDERYWGTSSQYYDGGQHVLCSYWYSCGFSYICLRVHVYANVLLQLRSWLRSVFQLPSRIFAYVPYIFPTPVVVSKWVWARAYVYICVHTLV